MTAQFYDRLHKKKRENSKSLYLALVLISSSLIGLAQKPSLVMRSGQAYFGRLEANVEGSIVVTPKRKAPDQSESSGLPQTCTAYSSPMTIFSWLQKQNFLNKM